MQLSDVFYALKHPKRALNFIMKERKIAKLCNCSMKEVRDSFKELNKSKLLTMLRLELKKFNFPLGTMLTPLRAPIIYVIVRALHPSVVVETGVANGVSSSVILLALEHNEHGMLYSIDLPGLDPLAVLPEGKKPGWIIPKNLRHRWRFILGLSQEKLKPLLNQLGTIDVFLHDSEHSYGTMTFEFNTAWQHLAKGRILIADDVTANKAFRNFVKQVKPIYHTYFGGLGAIRK